MWLVRLALRRPYTFIVLALIIVMLGTLSALRAPKDVFPRIAEPIVTVIWQYVGVPAEEFAKQITLFSEQTLSTNVSNWRRMESNSVYGKSITRIYFHPGVRVEQAVGEVTAASQTIIRRMLPGQTPPQINVYDASSVPILQVSVGGETLTEQELYDFATYTIRDRLAAVQGAAVPLPYGGRPRLIMVDLDPVRLQAKGLTAKDVNDALYRQNVNLPTGSTQIGGQEFILAINNSPSRIDLIGDMPVRVVNGRMVYIRDVADVRDGYNEQTSLVRYGGQKSALLTLLRTGGTSTLDVVRKAREELSSIVLPEGLRLSILFDQSVFVLNAIKAVAVEGLIGGALTGLLILLFLGSWRSTVVVVTSIPLAVLFSVTMLSALGHSLNLMTLGGLALAVGILVDDATVTIENIHRHLAMGKSVKEAILDGSQQIVVPAFVSMLCICIVFLPVTALTGAASYLFPPMALAVVFAVIASYFLSRTLVPVMARYLLHDKTVGAAHGGAGAMGLIREVLAPLGTAMAGLHLRAEHSFERLRSAYLSLLASGLRRRPLLFALFGGLVAGTGAVLPLVGQDFFPLVDAGQIRLHVNAPSGTRIEDTGVVFSQLEDAMRQVIDKDDLDVIIDNIGIPPSTNLAYSDTVTISSADGEILASLKPEHKVRTEEYLKRLRQVLPAKFPDCTFYFQPGDMMNQILNFGLPAPIDIKVIGESPQNYKLAQAVAAKVRQIPGAVDVHVHQIMN
jgi:multidrug efflux pump subunit AcrB